MNRSKLLKDVYSLDPTLRNFHDDHLIHILYGSEKFNFNLNNDTIKLLICCLKDIEHFDENLI